MLPATELRTLLKIAIDACETQNGKAFASLFLAQGELILPKHRYVGKAEIEKVTTAYLSACESVDIKVKRIIVESNQAVIEWHWSSVAKDSGQVHQSDNAIVIDFQAGAIARWREYSAT